MMKATAKKILERGPEWRYFGSPVFDDEDVTSNIAASIDSRGLSSSITSLLKPPKKIPRVGCMFCQTKISARSNSLRRHLRECTKCTDEARQYCVKIDKMNFPQGNEGVEQKTIEKSPDRKPLMEKNTKATQRRLKNRLACRANRKRKKAIRENLKTQVTQMCTENSRMHKDINTLLGYDSGMECTLGQSNRQHDMNVTKENENQQYWYSPHSELEQKAVTFFQAFFLGTPLKDEGAGPFYSQDTCRVICHRDTFAQTVRDHPMTLEKIWNMKSYLFDDFHIQSCDSTRGQEENQVYITIVEEGTIRDVYSLQNLFHGDIVNQIAFEIRRVGVPRIRLTWEIDCACRSDGRAEFMAVVLIKCEHI